MNFVFRTGVVLVENSANILVREGEHATASMVENRDFAGAEKLLRNYDAPERVFPVAFLQDKQGQRAEMVLTQGLLHYE